MQNEFKVNTEVRQGDTISSKIITNLLEYMFKCINWESFAMKIPHI